MNLLLTDEEIRAERNSHNDTFYTAREFNADKAIAKKAVNNALKAVSALLGTMEIKWGKDAGTYYILWEEDWQKLKQEIEK